MKLINVEGQSMGKSNIIWEERNPQRQSLKRTDVFVAMDTASAEHQTPTRWAHWQALKRVGGAATQVNSSVLFLSNIAALTATIVLSPSFHPLFFKVLIEGKTKSLIWDKSCCHRQLNKLQVQSCGFFLRKTKKPEMVPCLWSNMESDPDQEVIIDGECRSKEH